MTGAQECDALVLDGELTLRTINDVRTKICDALAGGAALQIDCDAATAVDLSFVQLLLAARRSAAKGGKSLMLKHPAAAALRETLARGGFLSGAGERGGDDTDFWLEGAKAT